MIFFWKPEPTLVPGAFIKMISQLPTMQSHNFLVCHISNVLVATLEIFLWCLNYLQIKVISLLQLHLELSYSDRIELFYLFSLLWSLVYGKLEYLNPVETKFLGKWQLNCGYKEYILNFCLTDNNSWFRLLTIVIRKSSCNIVKSF